MFYYHVFIEFTLKDKMQSAFEFGRTEKKLRRTIVNPYNKGRPFHFAGVTVHPDKINRIYILEATIQHGKDTILPDGRSALNHPDKNYAIKCFVSGDVKGIGVVTQDFLFPPGNFIEKQTTLAVNKEKIFIVYGRDEASALLLKNRLVKKGIDAEMFEDFKEKITGNTTVIEELIKIKDEISYAFVIATPDDLGTIHEEIKEHINELVKGKPAVKANDVCGILDKLSLRARQNVIFEYGLFLGVLGREKVQCLWSKKIGEDPSDIKGVLNIQFEKSIKETFTEIDDKLEKLGLIKK